MTKITAVLCGNSLEKQQKTSLRSQKLYKKFFSVGLLYEW